jgi:hypothetical protein
MDKPGKIRESIRKIAGTHNPGSVFLPAQVLNIYDETCDVQYGDLIITDVRLGAVIDGNANNLIIKPVKNSMVLIADLGFGEMRDFKVIAWSEIDTIAMVINGITLNGGDLGGLTKTLELKDQLAKMTARIDGIMNAIKNGVTVAQDGGASLKTSIVTALDALTEKEDFSNIEDAKIKH